MSSAMGTLKWGVICEIQAFTHLEGAVRSVELATLGRRVAEMEWDRKEAFLAALHSEEGKIAADDVPIYATGGVHFAHYEPTEG